MAVALALVAVILLQKSEGGAATLTGGSATGGFMTARSAASFLTRLTAILATVFMALCLLLAVLSARGTNESASIVEKSAPAQPAAAAPGQPATPAQPAAPSKPATPGVPLE